jgi:hypothetical protein
LYSHDGSQEGKQKHEYYEVEQTTYVTEDSDNQLSGHSDCKHHAIYSSDLEGCQPSIDVAGTSYRGNLNDGGDDGKEQVGTIPLSIKESSPIAQKPEDDFEKEKERDHGLGIHNEASAVIPHDGTAKTLDNQRVDNNQDPKDMSLVEEPPEMALAGLVTIFQHGFFDLLSSKGTLLTFFADNLEGRCNHSHQQVH